MMDWTAQIWTLARPGHLAAILGAPVPAPPPGWRVVRARCGQGAPLGPLHLARDQVEQRLGGRVGDPVVQRVASGLRRRLLGEPGVLDDAGPLVAELNRFADTADKTAILLDDVDQADPSTLALLRRLAGSPGWLRPALILSAASMPQTGALAELLRGLEREGALLRPPSVIPELPREILRTLRALAVVGGEAPAATLAALLGEDELRVLERVQEAMDLGFPVQDRGEGRLWLAVEQVEALRQGVTPSLAEAWRRRVAPLDPTSAPVAPPAPLDASPQPVAPPGPPPEPFEPVPAAPPEPPYEPAPREPAPAPVPVWPELAAPPEPPPAVGPGADVWPELAAPPEPPPAVEPGVDVWPELIAAAPATPAETAETPWPALPLPPQAEAPPVEVPPVATPWPALAEGPRVRPPPAPGPAPAASWGPPAFSPPPPEPRPRGEALDAAIRELLAGVAEAPTYAAPHLIAQLQEALALLDRLPANPARRALRARVHMELGRVAWLDAGLMPGLDLDAALLELERAARLLDALPEEVRLRAELRVLVASVCYDRGDAGSLERALSELTEAIRAFSAQGDPRTAARLLNDQAAVWVRIGDVVRAAHLLRQSRELLQGLGDAQPADLADLAETNHLLARLPLHVPSRPGRERDALHQALAHAREAEATYTKLSLRREQARVWSTLGQLHLLLDEGPVAIGRLHQAFELQERIGDALGLAQTAGALAEALQLQGDAERAVEMLSASIVLNANLGSAVGLRYNREALDAFARAIPPEHGPLRQAVAKLRRALDQAEGRQRR